MTMRTSPPKNGSLFENFVAALPSEIPNKEASAVIGAIKRHAMAIFTFVNAKETPTAKASILVAIDIANKSFGFSGHKKFSTCSSLFFIVSIHILSPIAESSPNAHMRTILSKRLYAFSPIAQPIKVRDVCAKANIVIAIIFVFRGILQWIHPPAADTAKVSIESARAIEIISMTNTFLNVA